MSLTAGFALGAGAAGILAQWAPLPSVLAYVLHIAITVLAAMALWRAPETRPAQAKSDRRRLIDDLKIPRQVIVDSSTSLFRWRRGCSVLPVSRMQLFRRS